MLTEEKSAKQHLREFTATRALSYTTGPLIHFPWVGAEVTDFLSTRTLATASAPGALFPAGTAPGSLSTTPYRPQATQLSQVLYAQGEYIQAPFVYTVLRSPDLCILPATH